MKPNSSFNLSKPVKRMLATIADPEQRRIAKLAFIDAELSAAIKPKFKDKEYKGAAVNE